MDRLCRETTLQDDRKMRAADIVRAVEWPEVITMGKAIFGDFFGNLARSI